jgi:hypothetical protein
LVLGRHFLSLKSRLFEKDGPFSTATFVNSNNCEQADYYQNVTEELDKAAQTYQEQIESYGGARTIKMSHFVSTTSGPQPLCEKQSGLADRPFWVHPLPHVTKGYVLPVLTLSPPSR